MEADAAVAVVHALGPEESVLLLRRSRRPGDPWSGHWAFPGGRREPGDSGLVDTALRELGEECGVRLSRIQLECPLPVRHAGQQQGRLVLVAPFLFRVAGTFDVTPDGVETESALWLPLAQFRDSARHRADAVPGLADGRKMPGIPLDGTPLWGFTYRVLCEWLGVSEPLGI